MSGRVIVVQASSSEDESMSSPVASLVDSKKEITNETTNQTKESIGNAENSACFKYDREDMLKLYNHPLAKTRPSILSPEFDMAVENGEGGKGDAGNHKLWSPELWIQSIWNPGPRQNSSVSGSDRRNYANRRPDDHYGHEQPLHKKKPIDRLKTENEDGIVLSPQRRSFGAGCQVASSSVAANTGNAGSQIGVGGTGATAQIRRSTSPPNAGGDDRQQQGAAQNVRSSFRSRGGANVVSAPIPQPSQVQNSTSITGSIGYGRGDRVENWRDRSGYSSSGFGRGNMGKDAPAPINTYARSRGGANSWNTGSNRRSYGGGYQHHQNDESLPEWVTEGPSDMFETMELRGFDDEERQEMQMEQNNGMAHKRGSGRYQQSRSPTGGLEHNGEKEYRRSIERSEQIQSSKRDGKGDQSRKSGEGDKLKMPAEALVDGFDIGDMAQFLSVAGADFDSITNGDIQPQTKSSSMIGKVIQGPATPTAASRFSKFFAPSGQNAGSGRGSSESKKSAPPQKENQPQSVNIMELLSKAAVAGESGQPKPIVAAGTASLPAGAKSLDEIEAAYKAKSAQKSDADGSPNKVLQELFQSARSTNAPQGKAQDTRIPESHQKVEEKLTTVESEKQPTVNHLSDQLTQQQQQALEMIQKNQMAMVNSLGAVATKGNPLADPAQQQHFIEALRKLHIQQQQVQIMNPQQHGEMMGRQANVPGSNEAPNPFLAAYPQLAGLQHLLQQQQQAMQMNNLQAAMNTTGRVPSPLGVIPGVVPVPQQQPSGSAAQAINPAFAGLLPPPNVPPPPITQQDLLLAHAQSIYQRALMTRKLQQGIEDQQPPPKPSVLPHTSSGKLPTAFLPTSVIKQMHGGVKPSKDGEEAGAGVRPIVKQQHPHGGQQEQVSPSSVNEQLMRNMQQQQQATNKPMMPGGNAAQQQAMAPPPSLTPQDLQRLIDQTQRQRQHQERVLLEQYAKAQQQVGANPAAAANMNPAAVSAALALQNNPVFVRMLKAQAMQAQQMAMLQQQAAAAAGPGMTQAPPQPIPASAAVSAIPNAAQLVRARLAAPPAAAAAAGNPDLMRHVFQQQQQQMLLHQLRQQAPGDANLLNRLLTGQVAQHQMPGVASQQASSMGGLHFPAQGVVDAKAMTLEELERLHKEMAAMQQPQS